MGLRPLYEMWARVSVKKTVKGGDILSTLSKERHQIISYFYSVLRFYDQCIFVTLVMTHFPFRQNLTRAKNISGPDLFQVKGCRSGVEDSRLKILFKKCGKNLKNWSCPNKSILLLNEDMYGDLANCDCSYLSFIDSSGMFCFAHLFKT